ncbi:MULTISPECIES: hypothetical protein [Kitasatospora]|uniref:Secreted protein n=1 Tax=Kitasatospora cathayae TaxID=3004092 RepID=A0ABY7QEY9_9ACTN|nr:hypothetical protein [Kitasatospora sp. HUAS 3-15]WBP91306.1 hypothetical protein O1G21_39105 [Kitasatospora sp. HUAS 3-15]
MRRIAATLAVLATAAAMTLNFTSPASAATGTLYINGVGHYNPSGCFPTGGISAIIANETGSNVFVYSDAGCQGDVNDVVQPGETTVAFGASLKVD